MALREQAEEQAKKIVWGLWGRETKRESLLKCTCQTCSDKPAARKSFNLLIKFYTTDRKHQQKAVVSLSQQRQHREFHVGDNVLFWPRAKCSLQQDTSLRSVDFVWS